MHACDCTIWGLCPLGVATRCADCPVQNLKSN